MTLAGVPLSYVWRNLAARRMTTLLTAGGLALVVFVFACTLMLAEGIRNTLVQTGQPDNVVVIRKGADTEVQSGISRGNADILSALPQIATNAAGTPLVSREAVVLITLNKRGTTSAGNVTVRGTTPEGLEIRPQARLVEGRMFRMGTSEVIAGRSLGRKFDGAQIGDTLRFAQREWRVVGVFDAGSSGFDSEIWGDSEQMMQAFRRVSFSSVVFRLNDAQAFDAARALVAGDPRLQVDMKRETQFYADQSKGLAGFISILGTALSVIFSIGAVVGAMITMYASVASRTGEIGTLRALGFPRRSVLAAFLGEALLLGAVGGLIGLGAASLMQNVELSTTNFQTFSELVFSFRLTLPIALQVLGFSVAMGFIGGFLPAVRASRMKIVDALREA